MIKFESKLNGIPEIANFSYKGKNYRTVILSRPADGTMFGIQIFNKKDGQWHKLVVVGKPQLLSVLINYNEMFNEEMFATLLMKELNKAHYMF